MATVKPEYRQLPVKLTEEERLARATKAGELSKKYRETESQKKATTSALGAQLKELRAEMEISLDASRTGIETQLVQVEKRRNEQRCTIELVRLDTKEVVETRSMTVEERQGKLALIEGGKTDAKVEAGPFGKKADGEATKNAAAKKSSAKGAKKAASKKSAKPKDEPKKDDSPPSA